MHTFSTADTVPHCCTSRRRPFYSELHHHAAAAISRLLLRCHTHGWWWRCLQQQSMELSRTHKALRVRRADLIACTSGSCAEWTRVMHEQRIWSSTARHLEPKYPKYFSTWFPSASQSYVSHNKVTQLLVLSIYISHFLQN